MRVDELRLERRGDGRELSGRVSFEGTGQEPQPLWFRSPIPPGELDASPFLAALLIMMGLELAGALDAPPFNAPLSRKRIRRLSVSTPLDRAFGEELLVACSRQRRFDLSDPIQIAMAEDYARRATKRFWVVARRWLRRRIGRIASRA